MKSLAIILVAICLAAGGCSQYTSKTGVVVASPKFQPMTETHAPIIPLVLSNGKEMSLRKASNSLCIVAFIKPPAGNPTFLDPRLISMNNKLEVENVSITQIAIPTKDCPLDDSFTAGCPKPPGLMIQLADPQIIAWNAFGDPDAGTLFLIDNKWKIVMTGNIADTDAMVKKAREIGQQLDDEQEQLWRDQMDW